MLCVLTFFQGPVVNYASTDLLPCQDTTGTSRKYISVKGNKNGRVWKVNRLLILGRGENVRLVIPASVLRQLVKREKN